MPQAAVKDTSMEEATQTATMQYIDTVLNRATLIWKR